MKNAYAMGELCTLMLQRCLTAEIFAQWVHRNYGAPLDLLPEAKVRWVAEAHKEPHPLDKLRALEFDKYLSRPGVEDSEFTRMLIELRNVFARNANLATTATVTLTPGCPTLTAVEDASRFQFRAPPASSELAAVLARLLCSQPEEDEHEDRPADWIVLGQLL